MQQSCQVVSVMNTGRSIKKGYHVKVTRILTFHETAIEPLETAIESDCPENRPVSKPAPKDFRALLR